MKGGRREGAGAPRKDDKRLHRVALCLTASEAATMGLYFDKTGVRPADVVRGLFDRWLCETLPLLK